jgi:hypothetical protein
MTIELPLATSAFIPLAGFEVDISPLTLFTPTLRQRHHRRASHNTDINHQHPNDNNIDSTAISIPKLENNTLHASPTIDIPTNDAAVVLRNHRPWVKDFLA